MFSEEGLWSCRRRRRRCCSILSDGGPSSQGRSAYHSPEEGRQLARSVFLEARSRRCHLRGLLRSLARFLSFLFLGFFVVRVTV